MNKKLINLLRKNKRTVIGLLSGTSVDAIDAVLLQVSGSGAATKVKVKDFIEYQVPQKIRLEIFKNSDKNTARIDDISRLNVIMGALFADAVLKILARNKISGKNVDLIGSHGQTIHHLPEKNSYCGFRVKSTLQIGDPSIIANLTGITTVGDFRIADCAVDGDGAPLVPYLDHILFTHKSKNRALLNIGGISNITVLKRNAAKREVFAFDTGPGNMIIDGLMYHLFKKKFDKNSAAGKKGNVNTELFNYLLKDKGYSMAPPKSTGREHYGMEFQKKLLKKFNRVNKFDIIRTVTEFTAYSIWYNYQNFIKSECRIDELIVSGGGAENPLLMNCLTNYFKGVKVTRLKDGGITTRNKEAILFAVLANECVSGNPANMNRVTGSTKDVILGKICQA
ncbi:MAG TPA: anhydro-N-acetylmuramic acid kinase [Ignavibacteria bacterium]|nr:anhydro-N-acetylmuramic acid kinase [Bacteroidota bacterium]HRE12485.1 anhydro-N-acetylmuramic acid kinase [Ignavibacteria bacterium]HRF66606.1 anhydro-N-acetylmuramic acid kinase [Ignavibacteria bacterium]HRJ03664.1 anhydro-N-acetylmuramic acid kinase [Ignavibacteria bacterium]